MKKQNKKKKQIIININWPKAPFILFGVMVILTAIAYAAYPWSPEVEFTPGGKLTSTQLTQMWDAITALNEEVGNLNHWIDSMDFSIQLTECEDWDGYAPEEHVCTDGKVVVGVGHLKFDTDDITIKCCRLSII